MWMDEFRTMLEGDVTEMCSSIPLSFRYGDARFKALPPTWTSTTKEASDDDQFQITKSVKDPDTGLLVTLQVSVYRSFPAVEWVVYFENEGEEDTPILETNLPLDIALSSESDEPVKLHQIHGDACNEQSFLPFETRLAPGQKVAFQPTGGRSSNNVFPYFTTEHRGEGLIVATSWTGQWKVSLSRTQPGSDG